MWPSVLDFAARIQSVAQKLNYGPEVMANYRGALENRASLFMDATFQDIFSHGGNTPIDELFPPNQDAIVEVEDLPPSEVDIRAFVMTLLLSRLRSVQASRDTSKRHPWVVVVEEAHNVLERSFEERRPADESNAGRTLLRTIVRLLQEGREMGIGLMVVDQSPVSLARSVMSNTGTKIVMRLEDASEMEEIGKAMGLDEAAWKKLGHLQVGEAIVKASYMDAPVKSAEFKDGSDRRTDVVEPDPPPSGLVPRYAELNRIWDDVFLHARRPDDEWFSTLTSAARQDLELAAFVGAKRLIDTHRNDEDIICKTHKLRTAHAAGGWENNRNLRAHASDAFNRNCVARDYVPLLNIACLMIHALIIRSSKKLRIEITGVGIRRACDILARAGIGRAEAWQKIMLNLVYATGDRYSEACDMLAEYCAEQGRTDVTVPIREILLYLAKTAHSAMAGECSSTPVELVLCAQSIVEPLFDRVLEVAQADDVLRARALADRLIRDLSIDFALVQCGAQMGAEIAQLLAVENNKKDGTSIHCSAGKNDN